MSARIDDAERRILSAVFERGEQLVVVDSPPGAGKTALVLAIAALAVNRRRRVLLTTVTNEQAYDVQRRLNAQYPDTASQLLHSSASPIPDDLRDGRHGLRPVSRGRDLTPRPAVTVANATKAALSAPDMTDHFDILIVDESYQLTFADFIAFAHLAPQTVLVGDPGQLPPVVTVDTTRFEAAAVKVHWPAPLQLVHAYPTIVPYQLPATRRLPADTTAAVAATFYPSLPFESAAPPRSLHLATSGLGTPIDRALDALQRGQTLIGVVLPRRNTEYDAADPELSNVIADLVQRVAQRGANVLQPDHAPTPITSGAIGIVDARVASGAETTRRLRNRNLGAHSLITTPETWQGLERPLVIAKHPLSGTATFDDNTLAPGRLCVMLTRHQVGCVLVTRDGVGDDIEAHVHTSSRRPVGSADTAWQGHRVHRELWRWMEEHDRLIRL